MKMLKLICAWCGMSLGEKDGKGIEGISHGICKKCLGEAEAQLNDLIGAAVVHG